MSVSSSSSASSSPSLKDSAAVVAIIETNGLLLLSDPKRQNAIAILTGEHPRGSWWSHPRANEIYAILKEVERHPDVAFVKLIAGKVTMVHRRLWPALLAVGVSRQPWQMSDLSPGAIQWVNAVDARAPGSTAAVPASRTIAKEIELRLLAYAHSVHGTAGKHETQLEPWADWARRTNCPAAETVDQAKQLIEAALPAVGAAAGDLPWVTPI